MVSEAEKRYRIYTRSEFGWTVIPSITSLFVDRKKLLLLLQEGVDPPIIIFVNQKKVCLGVPLCVRLLDEFVISGCRELMCWLVLWRKWG